MAKLNLHFEKLPKTYLFSEIEKKAENFLLKKPNFPLLNLGVGDVKTPLFPPVIAALKKAAEEMGEETSFRGYGPCEGYSFLRKAIAKADYQDISEDEVFISDGANTDLSAVQELFSIDSRIAVIDPAYPVYVETNVMAGRTRQLLKTGRYGAVEYLHTDEKNDFQPSLPMTNVDLIYLCSPNNPTGVSLTRKTLSNFVRYAKEKGAVLVYDGAYEAFITSDAPHSIYEIEGAKEVAVEIRSFSKSAGFTGLRCGYTVVPKELKIHDAGSIYSLNTLWKRRVDMKTNGVSYPIQRAAEALYTQEGQKALKKTIETTSFRSHKLFKGLKEIGYEVYGGIDSPYTWCKTPPKISSWQLFDFLLEKTGIITLPGVGFGPSGDKFIRFSAFAPLSTIEETLFRLKKLA